MKIYRVYFVILAVFVLTNPGSAAAKLSSKPNIVYIMADDHACAALGAYGGRFASLNPTPTIDQLARNGMVFTNCHVTNAICKPSRACLLTGQYNHMNKVYDLNGRLPVERQFLPMAMKAAGYQTALIGKWHLEDEPAAFDYYSVLPGQGKYRNPQFITRGPKPWPNNTFTRSGEHVTDVILDLSKEWLIHQRDETKPFMLLVHHKAPHDPFECAPRYNNYLAGITMPEPESLWQQPYFGSIATRGDHDELWSLIGSSIGVRHQNFNYVKTWGFDAKASNDEVTRHAYQEYIKRYLRCVKGVDDSVAALIEVLREQHLLDNTIIIYTSDQGMMLGEHDYKDKRWMYEESQRMPFIISCPAYIKPNSRSDALIENVDVVPTLLDFAGATTPTSIQGRSFASMCSSGVEPADWRAASYYRYWMHMIHQANPGHVGIRTKQYKLIFYYGMGRDDAPRTPPGWELYDVVKDPQEMINLYDNPAYGKTVVDLKQQLAALRKKVGDDGSDYPAIEAVISEFWGYDAAARDKAIRMSHEYLAKKQPQKKASEGHK